MMSMRAIKAVAAVMMFWNMPVTNSVIPNVNQVHSNLLEVTRQENKGVRNDQSKNPDKWLESSSNSKYYSKDSQSRADNPHLAKQIVCVEPSFDKAIGSIGNWSRWPLLPLNVPQELRYAIGVSPRHCWVRRCAIGQPNEDKKSAHQTKNSKWD